METKRTLTIVTREDKDDRGILDPVRDWIYEREEVSVEEIKTKLSDFLAKMKDILDGIPDKMSGYELDSVDMSVEISAKGTVSLLGTGGELGGTGGLVLHLKKKSSEKKHQANLATQ